MSNQIINLHPFYIPLDSYYHIYNKIIVKNGQENNSKKRKYKTRELQCVRSFLLYSMNESKEEKEQYSYIKDEIKYPLEGNEHEVLKTLPIYHVQDTDNYNKSYLWSLKSDKKIGTINFQDLNELVTINGKQYRIQLYDTIHPYAYQGFFKPSINEAIKPIPKEYLNNGSDKYISTIFSGLSPTQNFHLGITMLLVEEDMKLLHVHPDIHCIQYKDIKNLNLCFVDLRPHTNKKISNFPKDLQKGDLLDQKSGQSFKTINEFYCIYDNYVYPLNDLTEETDKYCYINSNTKCPTIGYSLPKAGTYNIFQIEDYHNLDVAHLSIPENLKKIGEMQFPLWCFGNDILINGKKYKVKEYTTLHKYTNRSKFQPTINETLSYIPKEELYNDKQKFITTIFTGISPTGQLHLGRTWLFVENDEN